MTPRRVITTNSSSPSSNPPALHSARQFMLLNSSVTLDSSLVRDARFGMPPMLADVPLQRALALQPLAVRLISSPVPASPLEGLLSVQSATTLLHLMTGKSGLLVGGSKRIEPRACTLTEPTMTFPFSYQ